MSSTPDQLDDPIWEYIVNSKLAPYVPYMREFWNNISEIPVCSTGVFPFPEVEGAPPGMMYRVTNTPVRSPIKNIQVFPFVPTAYLQITNVAGGSNKMIQRVLGRREFTIDEFTLIEKSHLPSTYNQGQFVAFVPTDILNNTAMLGKWVYLTHDEMVALCQDFVHTRVKEKLIKYI